MQLPRQPRWVYNDGSAVDYSMSLPQREWDYGSRGVGGSDVSAAGVPAAYEIRREYLLHLTLRFPVTEWADVDRLVRHLQGGTACNFRPDQDVPGVAHIVYGVTPAMGDEIRPRRAEEPETFELQITVRRTTAAIFSGSYHALPLPTFTSIVPDNGPAAGSTAVTITGTGFVEGATVTVGGAAATSVVVVSSTSITAVTPAGTIGARDVVITNGDSDEGAVTASGAFTYT